MVFLLISFFIFLHVELLWVPVASGSLLSQNIRIFWFHLPSLCNKYISIQTRHTLTLSGKELWIDSLECIHVPENCVEMVGTDQGSSFRIPPHNVVNQQASLHLGVFPPGQGGHIDLKIKGAVLEIVDPHQVTVHGPEIIPYMLLAAKSGQQVAQMFIRCQKFQHLIIPCDLLLFCKGLFQGLSLLREMCIRDSSMTDSILAPDQSGSGACSGAHGSSPANSIISS